MDICVCERINALHDKLRVAVFSGMYYTPSKDPQKYWSAEIELFEGDTKITVKKHAATYDEAINDAFTELELIVTKGVRAGQHLLMPTIEHEHEQKQLMSRDTTSETRAASVTLM